MTYNIQISASSTFDPLTKEADGLTSAAYTSAHLDDGKYYWRVRGESKYGIYGGWSAVRYFNLDTVRARGARAGQPDQRHSGER